MRNATPKFTRTSRNRNNVLSLFVSVVLIVVGFLIVQPFVWIVMILGYNFHYITFPIFLMITAFIVGGPMFLFGLISLLKGNHPVSSSSTAELDLGRIRYETEKRK